MKQTLIGFVLLIVTTSFAQKGARADFDYLCNLVVPDYKAKQVAFNKFTDSLENALLEDPEFIAFDQQSKKINSSDQDEADAAYRAELAKNKMKNATSAKVVAEYKKRFGGLNEVVNKIYEVLGQSGYDFVAIYEDGQVKDYVFKNQQIQGQYGQTIYKCAVAKGKETGNLDLTNKGSLSAAQMEIADSLMADCKKELLDPFISADSDITSLVEEALKN